MRNFDYERLKVVDLLVGQGLPSNAARLGELVSFVSYDLDLNIKDPEVGVVTGIPTPDEGSDQFVIISPLVQMGAETITMVGGTQEVSNIIKVYDRWSADRICGALRRCFGDGGGIFTPVDIDDIVLDQRRRLLSLMPHDPAHRMND